MKCEVVCNGHDACLSLSWAELSELLEAELSLMQVGFILVGALMSSLMCSRSSFMLLNVWYKNFDERRDSRSSGSGDCFDLITWREIEREIYRKAL